MQNFGKKLIPSASFNCTVRLTEGKQAARNSPLM